MVIHIRRLVVFSTARRKSLNISATDTVASYLAQKYCKDEYESVVPGSNRNQTPGAAGIFFSYSDFKEISEFFYVYVFFLPLAVTIEMAPTNVTSSSEMAPKNVTSSNLPKIVDEPLSVNTLHAQLEDRLKLLNRQLDRSRQVCFQDYQRYNYCDSA